MTRRTSRKDIVFLRPFILDGMTTVHPAGTYTVETEEENLDTVSSSTWSQVRTLIDVGSAGNAEYMSVNPKQLHEALIRDAAQQDLTSPNLSKAARAMRRIIDAIR